MTMTLVENSSHKFAEDGVPVDRTDSAASSASEGLDTRLIAYLTQLGLGGDHLAKIISLMQATPEELPKQANQIPASPQVAQPNPGPAAASEKTIRLHIAEEQLILKESYQSFFRDQSCTEVLSASVDTSTESLLTAASLKPDVILLGVKAVRVSTVEKLEVLRESNPKIGIVLLFSFYDAHGIKALREFARVSSSGCAYLLKHTVDTVEQLTQAIRSVAEGRIIVDPTVMEELIKTGDSPAGCLKDLSPKALEVLSWMAKGYRNKAIAEVLSRDVKTIERHINNIYGTLMASDSGSAHPRVHSALMYLRATGSLAA